MDKQLETQLVYDVITHPAGFILDLFGGMLTIRPTMFDFAVSWEMELDNQSCVSEKLFANGMEAATFFVEKRHQMQLGIDWEAKLMEINK